MQLTFLGTSAANAFPEAFCSCKNCQQARLLGGPSLRKRSAALVNDDLLIDLGPDIMSAAQLHSRPLTGVRYCLQTHAHADHMDPTHLLSRSPGFGVVGAPLLHFYASPATLQAAARRLERDCAPDSLLDPASEARLNVQFHALEPLRSVQVGGYLVTPFPANHDPMVEPLLYAIQGGGRTLFYGTDTASLPEETWQAFEHLQLKFDLVVLDHTYGPDEPASDHLNAAMVSQYVWRMRQEGFLAEDGRAFATHIAHEGNPPHPTLVEYASKHGYEVAYDGLTVKLGV